MNNGTKELAARSYALLPRSQAVPASSFCVQYEGSDVVAQVWWPRSALRRYVRSGTAVAPHFVCTMSALLP